MSGQDLDVCASYYFTQVVFQVESTLFRVPRDYFEQESEVFRAMFQLPVATGAVPDGSSNEQPLRLEGVSAEDFQQFLRVMFPSRPLVFENLTFPQWSSVLKLTALWQMDELMGAIFDWLARACKSYEDWLAYLDLSAAHLMPTARSLAIKNVSALFSGRPADKVQLGLKYQVRSWVNDGLHDMTQGDVTLSDEDGEKLGLQHVCRLYRARDSYRKEVSSYAHPSPVSAQLCRQLAERIIQVEFRSVLSGMTG